MPGFINGLKLIRAISKRWPVGSPGPGVGTHRRLVDDMPERTVGLRKPYAEHDLLNALEAVGTVSLQSRSAQLLRVSNPTRSQAA